MQRKSGQGHSFRGPRGPGSGLLRGGLAGTGQAVQMQRQGVPRRGGSRAGVRGDKAPVTTLHDLLPGFPPGTRLGTRSPRSGGPKLCLPTSSCGFLIPPSPDAIYQSGASLVMRGVARYHG